MRTVIISFFPLETQFIKDALSELQVFKTDKFTWYRGKFYTKDLYLIEGEINTDIRELIDLLRGEGEIRQIISIGLGIPISSQLRSSDLIISDLPIGSCEKLMDIFLNQDNYDDDIPLRIFAGQIYNEYSQDKNENLLACYDLKGGEILSFLRDTGLPAFLIRVIVPEANENNLEIETRLNVAQKLLLLLKKSIEYTS